MKWGLSIIFSLWLAFACIIPPNTLAADFPRDPVAVACQYVGETENLGANRSINIDKWNRFAGVETGSYWCASFVSWCYFQGGVKAPVSAWSPSFFGDTSHLVKYDDLRRNDSIGYYFPKLGRIGHIGLFIAKQGAYSLTVEGNTSPDDKIDRNGGGVYKRLRNSKLLNQERNKFSRW